MRRDLLVCAAVLTLTVSALAQKYEPSWESLDRRPLPGWWNEARFGIMICWGPYSVPSWAPKGQYAEWYWHRVKDKAAPYAEFQNRVFGKEWEYKQFGEMLKGEMFNAEEWARIIRQSGAKYVVMAANYHDGFCLWPSPYSPGWNAGEVGPKRDVLGEVTAAVRKQNIRMGVYYSLYEWYHPLWLSDRKRYVNEHFFPQIRDVCTKYAPSFIFADGEWEMPDAKKWRSEEFLAWLFNESPSRDEVIVNDRWGGTRMKHGSVWESEYGGGNLPPTHPWQEDRGIGASYGYNRNEDLHDYNTRGQLLQMLTRCAGNGGNFLLNIGPAADGSIPVIMQERLAQIGQWLKLNGTAIYGTKHSPFWPRKLAWGTCTMRDNTLYLHVHGRPADSISLPGLKTAAKSASFLAAPGRTIETVAGERGLILKLPEFMPDPDVSVIAVELAGPAEIDRTIRASADGSIALSAAEADIHGATPAYESGCGKDQIGYWQNAADFVTWTFAVEKSGEYHVEITYSCDKPAAGSRFNAVIGQAKLAGVTESTGAWNKYTVASLGTVKLAAGQLTLEIRPDASAPWKSMGLKQVTLKPSR